MVFLPLLVVIALIIKGTSEGPILFRQVRVGRYGKPFKVLKFRSMVVHDQRSSAKITVGQDSRITPIGALLRKSKLDELPQLANVLCGDMSLVGPRPEVPEYVALYSSEDKDVVLSVRPGLTDFASVRFRNESEILARQDNPIAYYQHTLLPCKLRYCRLYVRKVGFGTDFLILAWTAGAILGWVPRPSWIRSGG